MIGIIDYGAGNLRNVQAALDRLGVPARRVARAGEIAALDAVVLPGVGQFGSAARHLEAAGLQGALRDWLETGRPFLGICLGMQLLFESSQEDEAARGLGFFPGRIGRLEALRLPHIGWTTVEPAPAGEDSIFHGLPATFFAYFAHSYAAPAAIPGVAALASCPPPFAAAVRRGEVWGVQFHPEKSGAAGLRLLQNFARRAAIPPWRGAA